MPALKYDDYNAGYGEKLPWDLLPVEATEGMLRVLLYGQRKYTICGDCTDDDGKPTKIYPNPKLDGDLSRDDCPKCGSRNILTGAHNWRKGFTWTRLIAAAFRHLKAILQCEDIDPDSGEMHTGHLMCCIAFLHEHMTRKLGRDNRFRYDDQDVGIDNI